MSVVTTETNATHFVRVLELEKHSGGTLGMPECHSTVTLSPYLRFQ